MRKKYIIMLAVMVITAILGIIIYLGIHNNKKFISKTVYFDDVPEHNRISSDTDCVIYTDEELETEASIIAKVEVLDELSSKNSLKEYHKGYGMVIRFCAVRSVRILEVYKDNGKLSAGDEFQVQESCAIYEQDGEYYYETMDDIQPLKKGAEYILYLDSGADNMSGKPAIMSECNRFEFPHFVIS